MSIQHCPDEILDMIFQFLPIQSPDRAPAALLSTMLTCSRFCSIAKCHLIRVVCLQTAQSVNLFSAYLAQLTYTGAYGKALLPIVHMAVFGKHRITLRHYSRMASETERAAERILPFIISIAAPSLRSLSVLGFNSQHGEVGGKLVRVMVNPSICFPNLQKLVLLQQNVITLHRREGQDEDYPSHCYPQLTSLYTHSHNVNNDVLALRTLRELRVDMLNARDFDLPSPPILHLENITIDSHPYRERLSSGRIRFDHTRSAHHEGIDEFLKANPSSLKCSVVVTQVPCVHPTFVLDVWKDIVQGGSKVLGAGIEAYDLFVGERDRSDAGEEGENNREDI